jgi:uncharacterized protein YigE (DUF2233 family)
MSVDARDGRPLCKQLFSPKAGGTLLAAFVGQCGYASANMTQDSPSKLKRLLRLIWAFLLLGLIGWILGEIYFNLGSNAVALAVYESKQPLQVLTKRGEWKKAASMTPGDLAGALITRHVEEGLRWSTLKVSRSAGTWGDAVQAILGAEIHVVVVHPEYFEFSASYLPKFQVTTAVERLKTERLNFVITANFRDPQGKPLGYVYHQGKQVNAAFKEWSGSFFVKAGRPYFGPKSLLDEAPGAIEEATQGYPAVMKNHTIFSYIDAKPDAFFDGSKITYRALAGMRRDGVIVFVLSGDGGVMNVSEAAELARKLDVQHATLLDGGRALQYSLNTEDGPWHFAALNTDLDINRHPLDRQRSPVFIAVRKRAPEIIRVGH